MKITHEDVKKFLNSLGLNYTGYYLTREEIQNDTWYHPLKKVEDYYEIACYDLLGEKTMGEVPWLYFSDDPESIVKNSMIRDKQIILKNCRITPVVFELNDRGWWRTFPQEDISREWVGFLLKTKEGYYNWVLELIERRKRLVVSEVKEILAQRGTEHFANDRKSWAKRKCKELDDMAKLVKSTYEVFVGNGVIKPNNEPKTNLV